MARRGKQYGRSDTRKPVTIDLEATAENAAEQAKGSPDEVVDAVQPAEPVAMDQVSKPAPEADNESEADSAATAASSDDDSQEPYTEEHDSQPEAGAAAIGAAAGTTTIVQKRGVSAIGGGIVGGLLALVGAGGLQFAGVLPNVGGSDAPVVAPAPAVDLTPLEAQIAALQAELDSVSTVAPDSAQNFALPDDIVAQIESAAAAAADATARADAAEAALAGLSEQLTGLQQAVSSGEAGEGPGLEAIASRIDALETDLEAAVGAAGAEFDPTAAVAAVQPALDSINEQVAVLSADVDAASQTIEGVTGELATVQQGLQSVTEAQAQSAEQIAALSDRVTATAEGLEQAGGANTIAMAFAASSLKSAVDRGLPFMTEIEAFASVGGDAATIETLSDYAASGVPTQPQLVDEFAAVSNALVATSQSLGEDASMADRLMNSARSLVQVRDLNDVEGDSVTAIVNRMEDALEAGNLSGALAEWDGLPDDAKAVSADFADKVRARANVDGILSDVLNQAMSATTPSTDQ